MNPVLGQVPARPPSGSGKDRPEWARRRLAATIVGALALLGACGDGGGTGGPAGTASSTSASTSTTAAALPTPGPSATTRADEAGPSGIDAMRGASTATVTVAATNRETALLRAVRAARHEGYDRVVFEFGNVLPGYRVGYVARPVLADGSGQEVAVDGAHVVQVVFENALDADLSQESAPRTYTGPDRLRPGTPEVVELVRTGGFEGRLTWVIGLRDRVDFRVTTLTSPPRVVVDLRNH